MDNNEDPNLLKKFSKYEKSKIVSYKLNRKLLQ